MLGAMLGSASQHIATPESQFKELLPFTNRVKWDEGLSFDRLQKYLEEDFRFRLWDIDIPPFSKKQMSASEYKEFVLTMVHIYAQKQRKEDCICWIDHTPENLQYFNTLSVIFPESVFIHLIRDPRAIASSVMKLDWGPNTAKESANFWAANVSWGLGAELFQPDRVLRIKYEELIEKPKETLKSICKFAKIEYNSSMLEAKGFNVPEYTRKQHLAVGNIPDTRKINLWKKGLKAWQIYRIEHTVGDLMNHFGYEMATSEPIFPSLVSRLENGMKLIFGWYINRLRLSLRKRKAVQL